MTRAEFDLQWRRLAGPEGSDVAMAEEEAARLSGPAPMAQVITHGGPDRRFRVCRCRRCGIEARCTPGFDFFVLPDDPCGPLHCEACFRECCRTAGLPIVDLTTAPQEA